MDIKLRATEEAAMMPTYKVTVQAVAGNIMEFWTQDPEGLAARYRESGAFVSSDMPREDAPITSR